MGGGKISGMEKKPRELQEYRDELADKLKEIRNQDEENPELAKAEARGYLSAVKEIDPSYNDARQLHMEERDIVTLDSKQVHVVRMDEIGRELNKLNKELKKGEKPWRLMTDEEYYHADVYAQGKSRKWIENSEKMVKTRIQGFYGGETWVIQRNGKIIIMNSDKGLLGREERYDSPARCIFVREIEV